MLTAEFTRHYSFCILINQPYRVGCNDLLYTDRLTIIYPWRSPRSTVRT
ncbi:MAG: hypothetical protein HC936_05525 [Leptolyngbyaceae cyanobacterium SU_3_3]|nr:hypothetical protein [Leptolyngbyaceae cyanobacterium SU_3_3]